MRTFSLNSDEAYEALCTPRERAWILNGSLSREPRVWGAGGYCGGASGAAAGWAMSSLPALSILFGVTTE